MRENGSFIGLLYDASWAFAFLPFFIALITIKFWAKYRFFTPLFSLLAVALLIEILQGIKVGNYIRMYYVASFYTIVEFILITIFYASFFKKYFHPWPFYLAIPVLFISVFFDYSIDGLKKLDGFSMSVECIVMIGFSMFFFYYVLKHLLIEDKLINSPVFWINTAILLYFSGNLFMFSFNNYLTQADPAKRYILWGTIHSFFNIMFNLFIAIGFWKTKTK